MWAVLTLKVIYETEDSAEDDRLWRAGELTLEDIRTSALEEDGQIDAYEDTPAGW